MRKKQILSLFLAFLTIAQISLTACSNTGSAEEQPGGTAPSANQNADAAKDPAETRIDPGLPEKDFGGYEFRMLGKGTSNSHWKSMDLTAEELTGDAINDAVFQLNLNVAEKYKVNFVEYAVSDYFNQGKEFTTSVLANADDYDMAALKPDGVVSSFISNGYVVELGTVPYMNLSQPWYDQNMIRQMSIGGKLYLVMGDMLTMDNDAIGAVFFNKKLAGNYQLENLYTMVDEGRWTIDKMTAFAETAAQDINGDGVMKPMDDVWGALTEYSTTFALNSGAGVTMISKNECDLPILTAGDEQYTNMYEKVLKLQNNWDIALYAESVGGYSDVWAECLDVIFESDRALFNICWMNRASLFRDMETDFGIIPLPKYDEAQDGYHSFVSMYCANSIEIPKTAPDLERTGIIIEALSCESKYLLTPAYYDKTLKSKESRDVESSRMLDVIFATTIYDLGYMFNWGGICSAVGSMVGTAGGDISGYASALQKSNKSITKNLEKDIKAITNVAE
jgi:hypothetical protein